MQRAACSVQRAACSVRLAACSVQRAACSVQLLLVCLHLVPSLGPDITLVTVILPGEEEATLGPGQQVLLLLELELAVVVVPVVVLGRHVVQPLGVQEPQDGRNSGRDCLD